jgi:hypothetical protein
MTDGTEQRERQPSALAGDYFQVDETTFGQFAAAAAGFASHLRLHGSTNGKDSTWAALFDTDELLVMAGILGFDPRRPVDTVLDDFDAAPLPRLTKGVLQLAAVLDDWYRKLHAIDAEGAHAVSELIASLVHRHLADDMSWLRENFAPPSWQGELKGYAGERLDAMWFQPGPVVRPRAGRSQRELLRSAVFALLDAMDRVKKLAAAQLPASRESGRHDPAAGLLIAFLELFQGVQRRMNGFTARHTNFYYGEVLAMQPRRAQPDRVHLACQPVAAGALSAVVPKGTRFAAGKDEQDQPIEFLAEHELVVTDLQVAALRTLRLERALLVLGPATGDRFDCVKRVKADVPMSAAVPAGAPPAFWPLFGGNPGQGGAPPRDADIGLAIASPVLWLKEGQREIRIVLTLRDTAAGTGLWGRMAKGDSLVQWQFVRALPALFRVSLTTAAGWWDAGDCYVARYEGPAGTDCVELTVRLRPESPAVTGCVPALHGAGWNTALPMVRIAVRQDAALCAYSLLERAELQQVTIDVKVRGARDVALRNQLGRLDPATPFMPFGPMAEPGAYLVFGSAEAAAKPVKRLCLNIQWGGLPRGPQGFAGYYEGYDTEYTDTGFKARVSVLQEGQWRVSPSNADGRSVFAAGPAGQVIATSRVVVEEDELQAFFKPAPAPRAGQPFTYDVGSRSGFFRWELREPEAGFGHAEYAHALTRVVTANARRKKPLPLPNPPYTPVIERITLDYEAQAVIRLGREGTDAAAPPGEVFHLLPFGQERIHPGSRELRTVLPVWASDGNLYIGLSGTDPQGTLSLLFELRGEAAEPLLHRATRITWACLSGNRWCDLPSARVLADTTGGFLTSGIVTLDLPAGLDRDATIMPAGLAWLRVSADTDFDSFAALYSVRAQALCAVRSPSSPLPQTYEALRPGSVTGPIESIPGLARVVQVGPSFGMRPVESGQQLQVRTGERLKHKNRALLPWDYERLVLERFPAVFKVRCFPHLRAPDAKASPGSVMVVVVPALGGEEERKDVPGPRLNAIELERIESYLKDMAPPFADITVRNATYERIQVRCSVAWKQGSNGGYCERLLSQALFDFLSPWNDNGYRARFEWAVRREDIEARLRELPYVDFVTGVSLLHVAASDARSYTLDDTARPGGAKHWHAETVTEGLSRARARWPWSIAVPMRHHLILTQDKAEAARAPATGVGALAIGNTFVVGGAA